MDNMKDWTSLPMPELPTGRGSLLNHLSCSPDDLIGKGTELNIRRQKILNFTHVLSIVILLTEETNINDLPFTLGDEETCIIIILLVLSSK